MAEAVSVGEIVTKLRSERDDSGDVWFAIAADVTNNTQDPVEIRLKLQAVDSDGFELTDLALRGVLRPGETKRLSDQDYMPHKDYLAIAKWQIDSLSVDEPE
jgi:hypothetical protein